MRRLRYGMVGGVMAGLAAVVWWQCRRAAADARDNRGRVIFRNAPRPSELWKGTTEHSGVGA